MFFHEIIEPLRQAKISLEVNQISFSTNLILMSILPCHPQWISHIERSRKPFIAWHWDWYSFVDTSQDRWKWFLRCLPRAVDVWSCTYEVARQLKERTGIDSYVMPSWVVPENFSKRETEDYVYFAEGSGSLGKRFDWAERACQLLGYELRHAPDQSLPIEEYRALIEQCRVYLMPAFEESNATIPAQEAGACDKAVVLADIPSNREVFGKYAYYFDTWNFGDLLRALKLAWMTGPVPGVKNRIVSNYSLSVVFPRLLDRLQYVLSRM